VPPKLSGWELRIDDITRNLLINIDFELGANCRPVSRFAIGEITLGWLSGRLLKLDIATHSAEDATDFAVITAQNAGKR
jgi:hypothetical protein